MIKKIASTLLITAFVVFTAFAQELRCNVTVSARGIQGANQNLFRTMQSDIYDFMNNRKWTEHVYGFV